MIAGFAAGYLNQTGSLIVLLTLLWRGRSELPGWVAAGAVALAAHRLLPGQWYIVLGALAGSAVGARRAATGDDTCTA